MAMRGLTNAVVLGALALNAAAASASPGLDYARWLRAEPMRRAQVAQFEAYLRQEHVAGVIPTGELLLNATSWRACGVAAPYTVAERPLWPHVVATLRYIRDQVKPVLGPVDVVSGYRNEALNRCSGGAPQSAHRNFFALDIVPRKAMDRETLVLRMCHVHDRSGAKYHVGLGFYEGLRFHIDTQSYRLWGSDHHAATSPCLKTPVAH
jgi:hypothetical protein